MLNLLSQPLVPSRPLGTSKIVAHRGSQICTVHTPDQWDVYIENTLAAFKHALDNGQDLEFDVNANGDNFFKRKGQPVTYKRQAVPFVPVFHDNRLGEPFAAPNGSRPELRYAHADTILMAEFQQDRFQKRVIEKRLGNSPEQNTSIANSPQETRIPTLDEVLALLKKYPERHAYIEMKSLSLGNHEKMKGLPGKVLEVIKLYDIADQVTIISFNPFMIEAVNNIASQKKWGERSLKEQGLTLGWDMDDIRLKTTRTMQKVLDWSQNHVDVVMPSYDQTTQYLVDEVHARKMKIMPYVYRDDRQGEIKRIPQLMGYGVDGVISNIPCEAQQLVQIKQKALEKP